MVEFLVGLVAILALVAGFLQVTELSTRQTDTLVEAREEAGIKAMQIGGSAFLETDAQFLETWEPGSDGNRHTPDDEPVRGNASAFLDTVVEGTSEDPEGWAALQGLPNEPMTELRGNMNPSTVFGLVKGEATESVPLLSAVRSLIYRKESITVRSTVWMTGCSDLY
jgi:hypothetical protein